MATKKSTPKKTNTKTKTSVARTAKKAFDEGIREITGAKASAARSAATSGAKGRTIPAATKEQKQTSGTKTSGTKTSTPKTSNASTARGQRLNSSASMPKGVSGRIDRRADGTLVTEPPKSNRKRFLPVDHGAAGELPAGATSAKYDSYTGKFVPVYESGSKKKSTKKDLPRDYGL